jgi:hypothetical protein
MVNMQIDGLPEQEKQPTTESAKTRTISKYIIYCGVLISLGAFSVVEFEGYKIREHSKSPIVQEYLYAERTRGQLEHRKQERLYKPGNIDKVIEYIFEPNLGHLERAISYINTDLIIMEEKEDVKLYHARMNHSNRLRWLIPLAFATLITLAVNGVYSSLRADRERDKKHKEALKGLKHS